MNGNKKIIISIIIVIIVVILTLIIYNFFKNYQKDKKETQEKINTIIDNYDLFKSQSNEITKERDNIYSEIFSNNYYEEMNNKIENFNNLLTNYENSIKKIDNDSKNLKIECKNIRIMNSEINQKCGSFNDNYEVIINLFVNDIEMFNKNIDDYNEWLNSNKIDNKNPLKHYVSNNYNDYIDFNGDGTYKGKQNEGQ